MAELKRGVTAPSAAFLMVFLALGVGRTAAEPQLSLIDDFTAEVSALGTRWEGFTDRVMGGVSQMQTRIEGGGAEARLHLTGEVSLKNNGGFIQVRLPLAPGGKPFDAGGYTGIALRVRGRQSGYYVHLRTTRTVFPWSLYAQGFAVSDDWSTVYLPFEGFRSENMARSALEPRKLVSVGIVAAKREFSADLEVDWVAFYR